MNLFFEAQNDKQTNTHTKQVNCIAESDSSVPSFTIKIDHRPNFGSTKAENVWKLFVEAVLSAGDKNTIMNSLFLDR